MTRFMVTWTFRGYFGVFHALSANKEAAIVAWHERFSGVFPSTVMLTVTNIDQTPDLQPYWKCDGYALSFFEYFHPKGRLLAS